MTQEEEEKKQYTPVNDTEEETNDFATQKFNGYPHDPYAGATNVVVNPNEKDSYANALYQQSLGDNSAFATPEVKPLPTTPYNPVNTESKLSEVARQDKQNRERRFVKPNPNPTTYKEHMENMEAENEYNQQMYDRSKKWRTIANAIIGAGAIAGHIATGTAMPNTFMQTWDQTDKDALEELRYHRQMNMDKYNKQIALMQQDKSLKIAQANKDREFGLSLRKMQNDAAKLKLEIDKAEQQGELTKAKVLTEKYKALQAKIYAENAPAKIQSEINRNNSTANKNYATANKANADTTDLKTKNIVYAGGKQYKIPKNMKYMNVRNAIAQAISNIDPTTLNSDAQKAIEDFLEADFKYDGGDKDPEILNDIDKMARLFPDVVDKAITNMIGNDGETTGKKNHKDNPFG